MCKKNYRWRDIIMRTKYNAGK